MSVIITSPYKGKRNWSGKSFTDQPAKLYTNFDDAVSALNSYCFFKFDPVKCEYVEQEQDEIIREIRIIHLTEKKQNQLMAAGKVQNDYPLNTILHG
jgi:hypothetical protein